MTFFPATRAARRRSRSTAGAALGLLGVLLLTGCESAPAEQPGTAASTPDAGAGGVQQQVPEPSGNQLSHEEMREQLESRYPEAALSDTADYWAGLRDIETELQRLVVDPPECKQYVVRSAVPVPAGALVAFADETAEGFADADPGAEDGEQSETSDESAPSEEPEESQEPEGAGDDPEASAREGAVRFQLASTEDEESAGEESEGEAADEPESETAEETEAEAESDGETDAEADSDGESGSDADGDAAEAEDSDAEDAEEAASEEEPESAPVTVDLPAERQALIYTFSDWRAADAYLSAEQDGLESCDSYTASRGGEDSEETSTSVDTVDVSSSADDALGTTRRISAEGETEHSAAVTLRTGSHIVTVAVPLSEALSEDEAEAAAEELEAEAADLIESLD